MCFETTIDLRDHFQPIRDQGKRGSCLPMSVSAIHEFDLAYKGYLSAEALYFGAASRMEDWRPFGGIRPSEIAIALEEDGQPAEKLWPYLSIEVESVDEWPVPDHLEEVWKSKLDWFKADWNETIRLLKDEAPVVAILNITDSFLKPNPNGLLLFQPEENPIGCHAVVFVGIGQSNTSDEEALLIRNSWGDSWGDNGHAWFSQPLFEQMAAVIGILPNQ